ncbi:MAG: S8 family peptidase [Bdellovibrionales bacterium]|nr:S8 family peptidase [Bdellovibrionales bacterium]
MSLAFAAGGCGLGKEPGARPAREDRVGAKGTTQAQTAEVKNWFTKDSATDGVEGVRAELAYSQSVAGAPQGEPVIVAVLDSGVDAEHEDIKNIMWVNPGEIAGNGLDDDSNGFIDDIHGWNFLGSRDASGAIVNVDALTLEMTRELRRMRKLKADAEAAGGALSPEQEAYFVELRSRVDESRADAQAQVDKNTLLRDALQVQFDLLAALLAKEFKDVKKTDVEALTPTEPALVAAQAEMVKLFTDAKVLDVARVLRRINVYGEDLKYYYNEDFDPRKDIIGDDPTNYADRAYGNNDVKGPDASHGTHVAGIIAASRGNGLGIDGVADHVRIMSLRMVPNGDEYDKDIANAVRYAVDNGAKVINMSFGKGYSPGKTAVDEAFLYAASKGVLMVHAAGNSAADNDSARNFPNRRVGGSWANEITPWLEVGASASLKGPELPAVFSNYGMNSVDLFAPGVAIESTIPDTNAYASFSGTSMASPVVAGVAALVLSRHPELDGGDLKRLLARSARGYGDLKVNLPTEEDEAPLVPFFKLSISGGIADVLSAFEHLQSMRARR